MKRPDFGNDLKVGEWFLRMLRIFCILEEFKFPHKYLGYLTGHRRSAVVNSSKYGVRSGEELGFCVTDICQ
jgi:hypothetical protein